MLRSFRQSIKGRTGKVLLGIIIVPFVLFGAESLLTGGGGAPAALDVNGEEIDQVRLAQEVVLLRNEILTAMGDDIDFEQLSEELITPQALQRLLQTTLIKQAFEELSLSTPEALLQQNIVQTPAFQTDGKFSSEVMNRVLADQGFNLNMLKERLSEDLRSNQLRTGVALSSFTVPQEVQLMLNIINEARSIHWTRLSVEEFRDNVSWSEEDLTALYEADQSDYMTEMKVAVEYIALNQEDLIQPVEEQLLLDEYESQKEQLAASERRQVSHILFEINSEQSESDARRLAEEVNIKIAEGEPFGELARSYSQDSGSASDGGQLGFVEQDQSFPEAFEQAVFNLALHEVSEPIMTDAGLHLITITSIEQDEIPEFSEMRSTIEKQIQLHASSKEYITLTEQLADLAFNSADLAQPAEELGLQFNVVNAVGRSGVDTGSEFETTVFSDSRVLNALFSDELLLEGLNSELIEISAQQSVVVRVRQVFEPRQLSFDEVRDQLTERVAGAKARQKMNALVERISVQVAGGEGFATVLGEHDLQHVESTGLTRQSQDIERVMLDAAFAASRSSVNQQVDTVTLENGDQYLFQLTDVSDSNNTLTGQELKALAQQANAMISQQTFNAYINNLEQLAEVKQF